MENLSTRQNFVPRRTEPRRAAPRPRAHGAAARYGLLRATRLQVGRVDQEAALDGDVRDVRAPDVIGSLDSDSLEQIGTNTVLRMRSGSPGRLVDGLQAHQAYQTPHPVNRGAGQHCSLPGAVTVR